MEQLFVISRYDKTSKTPSSASSSEQFNSALKKLLSEAKNRQHSKVKSEDDPETGASPKTAIKRKLFLTPKKPLKVRITSVDSDQNVNNSLTNNGIEIPVAESIEGTLDDNKNLTGSTNNSTGHRKWKKSKIRMEKSFNGDGISAVGDNKKELFDVKTDVFVDNKILNTSNTCNLDVLYLMENTRKEKKNKTTQNLEQSTSNLQKVEFKKDVNHSTSLSKVEIPNPCMEKSSDQVQSEKTSIEVNKNLDGSQDKKGNSNLGESEGFTIIGHIQEKQKKQVTSALPHWLAHPVIISTRLQDSSMPVSDMPHLDPAIASKLMNNNIKHFFPVQQAVIPWTLKSLVTANVFRPSDICVSAPTGSGKTLAYLIPVLQALQNRLVPLVRAIVLLPVKDLAIQVYKVFLSYLTGTDLKVALIVGQKSYELEVKSLVRPNVRGGFSSRVDIVIATPSRLIHHIQHTSGFSLHNLRFLIVDEADRMMEDLQEGWFSAIEKAVQSKKMFSCQCKGKLGSGRFLSGPIIPCCHSRPVEPCQKLLFSATLSQDPEKLKRLSLFHPKLFTCVVENQDLEAEDQGAFIGKFSIPDELTEISVKCEAQTKPLMLWYLLKQKVYTNVLCFTNTIENSYRLSLLLRAFGNVNVQELSSHLNDNQRKTILNKFSSGKLDILVCSDMMARGMDLDNVNYVICYDTPPYVKTYIHRIGRTARAGRTGTAVTLLEKEDIKKFKKLMKTASRPTPKEMCIPYAALIPFEQKYKNALESVAKQVIDKERNIKQDRNIF